MQQTMKAIVKKKAARGLWLEEVPVPKVGVNGDPSLALKIAPTSQPFTAQAAGPVRDFRPGIRQVPLITRFRPTLKSDTARLNFKSNQ